MTQHEYLLPGQFSITTINAVYYKTDHNFQHQKNLQQSKSYSIGDWTVHMLQLHRLPLLAVTGQKPHNKEKAKISCLPRFRWLEHRQEKGKGKERSLTPHYHCCTSATNKYWALVVLAASQVFLHKSNKYTYFSSQSTQHARPMDCSDYSNCHETTLQFLI